MVQQTTDKKPVRKALRSKKRIGTPKQKKRYSKTYKVEIDWENTAFPPVIGLKKFPKSQRNQVKHIVIHTTGTKSGSPTLDLDHSPYHFVITKSGKIINIRDVENDALAVQVALVGGMDKEGNLCDTRTTLQSDILFHTLVMLTEFFPKAKIVGADTIYVYNHPNPGFDITTWLCEYIPDFLQNA